MSKDIWNKEPLRWKETPLGERLELLRKFHCTEPCGQSSDVIGNASALGDALRDAAERIRELEEENKNLQVLLVKRTRLADLYRTRFNQQQEGGGE